ncbi:hypothetical protein RRSWK_03943 [Rhodopirellula sp. SWK7]|nr:hypothetical protein RRSWK_03943 [Rhodopirellula sp. SWK7]
MSLVSLSLNECLAGARIASASRNFLTIDSGKSRFPLLKALLPIFADELS